MLILFFVSFSQGQWQGINQPTIGTVSIIHANGNELLAATNQAQVFTSVDQANSWELLADTLNTQPYASDLLFFNDKAVFFTQNIGSGPYNYICPSVSSGWGSWQELPHQSSALTSMVGNDTLILTILNGISISSDLGQSWSTIPDPPFNGYIQLHLITNDYLYVSHGCQVFRTADLGQTWENITGILDDEGFISPYNCSTVLKMAAHGNQLIISMYWGGGLGKLFVSGDYGTSWTVLNEFPVDHSVNAIVSKHNVLYVGTASTISGVYYTTDLISWTDFSSGLESYDRSVSQLVATDEYLYKTGSTINSHQVPLPELNTTWERLLPLEFSLYQNYPNPFNPATIFRYDLPKNTNVKLTIYDLMGKIVKNLVSDQQNPGYKLIQWNSTNNKGQPVSAGMYFYTIQAGEFRQTRKMVLLK
jgi:hypothetical protein